MKRIFIFLVLFFTSASLQAALVDLHIQKPRQHYEIFHYEMHYRSTSELYGYTDLRYRICLSEQIGASCREGVMLPGIYNKVELAGISNFTEASFGSRYSCFLDSGAVFCSDSDFSFQRPLLIIPADKHPRMMTLKEDTIFTLTDEGLIETVIGNKYQDRNTITGVEIKSQAMMQLPLGSIKLYSRGNKILCAIDTTDKLACIKDTNNFGERITATSVSPPFQLTNATSVVSGDNSFCAIDDNGLRCWIAYFRSDFISSLNPGMTNWFSEVVKVLPATAKPRAIVVGDPDPYRCPSEARCQSHCALDAKDVTCWNEVIFERATRPLSEEQRNFRKIKGLRHPRKIFSENCALDSEGLKCWGSGDTAYLQESIFQASTELEFTETYLNLVAQSSTGVRSRYFSLMKDFASKAHIAHGFPGYLMMKLITPAILSANSVYFLESIIPNFQKKMTEYQSQIEKQSRLNKNADSDKNSNRIMALKSLQFVLQISLDLVPLSEQAPIRQTLRLVAQAQTAPTDESIIQALLTELKTGMLDSLSGTKTSFLIDLLATSAEWLDLVQR